MVLAYDLLEARRTIDVIITKFFPPCFKMAESFDILGNVLRDWAKDKGQKSLVEALNRFEKQEEERMIQKKFSNSLSQKSSETKSNTTITLEFNKLNKQYVSEINLFKN